MPDEILTVHEITVHVKRLLDSSDLLQGVMVRGEVSNFKRHTSGHVYFSLKDEQSQLSCVMFRGAAQGLRFDPEDGMLVVAGGDVSVYERGGRYQLYVKFMRPDGLGGLFLAFERLKQTLEAEGLFDAARKRPLPPFPQRIALLTSPTGAAIRDLTAILARRFPVAEQILVPTLVQGDEAPASIVESLRIANTIPAVDLIILGRGGGSIEDLWGFNDGTVARAIFASKVPVVSAVGHETDFTIADFVADVRAPTPSAAAELAVPDRQELLERLNAQERAMRRALLGTVERWRLALGSLVERRPFRYPLAAIQEREQELDELVSRANTHFGHGLALWRAQVDGLDHKLAALGPVQTLQRGYALCTRREDGRVVTRIGQLAVGDAVDVRLSDGQAGADVTSVEEYAS